MHFVRLAALAGASALLAACVTVTELPRAVVLEPGSGPVVKQFACSAVAPLRRAQATALDPARIRLATWNIHKQADPGWQGDLVRLAGENDLLLIQELVLRPDIRRVIEGAGMQWVMANSFLARTMDVGVLTAARVTPVASCTTRVIEPLLRLPKSTVITWYALQGTDRTLAVANMHAINFALSLGSYREQMTAVRTALQTHDGPIVFAGDLNTWTEGRSAAVRELARALGLEEIRFARDRRRLFLGRQLDHILVRGLSVTTSSATEVTSSDHNPVEATLALDPRH